MKITNSSILQQVNNKNNQAPSFQANFVCGKGAKSLLKAEWSKVYEKCTPIERKQMFNDEPFDFKKLFANYKTAVETATNKIKGTIKLYKDNGFDEHLKLTFKFPSGKYLDPNIEEGHGNFPSKCMLPHSQYDKGKPLSRAVGYTLGGIVDIEPLRNPFSKIPTKENPFMKLYNDYYEL